MYAELLGKLEIERIEFGRKLNADIQNSQETLNVVK